MRQSHYEKCVSLHKWNQTMSVYIFILYTTCFSSMFLQTICKHYFLKKVLFIFRERGRERERGTETSIRCILHTPGTCLGQESNQQPFGLWEDTKPTEIHQSGLWTLFLKIWFIFREKVREGEIEREKHQCVVASCTSPTGDQACAPTRNQTGDPLVHRPVLNPVNHSSQGWTLFLNNEIRLLPY